MDYQYATTLYWPKNIYVMWQGLNQRPIWEKEVRWLDTCFDQYHIAGCFTRGDIRSSQKLLQYVTVTNCPGSITCLFNCKENLHFRAKKWLPKYGSSVLNEACFWRSSCLVSIEVLFEHTEKWNWRNALWEYLDIFCGSQGSLICCGGHLAVTYRGELLYLRIFRS